MVRLGGIMMFLGFVSAILHFTSRQLVLLMWSEPMQPALGLILGGGGVLVVVLAMVMSKDKDAPAQPVPGAPGFAPPQGFQQQQPGPMAPNSGPMPAMQAPMQQPMPPQGYPQQPGYGAPQGYPQQPGHGAPQGGFGPQG